MTREDRIQWLLVRAYLWLEKDTEQLWMRNRELYKSIGSQMRKDGLFSSKTSFIDMRIGSLINDARERLRNSLTLKASFTKL